MLQHLFIPFFFFSLPVSLNKSATNMVFESSSKRSVHHVSAPRYGEGRVTPDLKRTFASCSKPMNPSMYLEAGRTVQLNIKRLPTPSLRRDHRTTILLGGHTSFGEMVEHRTSVEISAQTEAQQFARTLQEQQRFEAEYELAVRREKLLRKQVEEHEKPKTSATSFHAQKEGFMTLDEILSADERPVGTTGALPPRALTPAQQTRRTLRGFAERAKTPDLSFDALYSKAPTHFSVHTEDSKQRDEYESIPPPRPQSVLPPPSPSLSVQRATTAPSHTHSTARGNYTGRSRSSSIALPLVENIDDPFDLNTASSLRNEVDEFEHKRAAAEEEEQEYSEEIRAIIRATQIPPPPKLILMLFRFGNVRNLPITQKLRDVGYPMLHEQFSSNAERGCITRQHFLTVIKRYAEPGELNDALRLLNCFDKSATGDVEINHFLLGMQILLQCASAGDTLKYCFSLMDTNNRVPRYVTRFEVQSLLSSALAVRKEKLDEQNRLGLQAHVEEEQGDQEFDIIARAIHEVMEESWRYDYMGRIGLKDFLKVLQEKVAHWKRILWDAHSPRGKKRVATLLDSMGMGGGSGNNWTQPCVAAAHRMSSKKMLYSSLQYQPINSLKDPYRIPAPMSNASFRSASSNTLLGNTASRGASGVTGKQLPYMARD